MMVNKICVSLNDATVKKLEALCKHNEASTSYIVRQAIKLLYEKEVDIDGKTKESVTQYREV